METVIKYVDLLLFILLALPVLYLFIFAVASKFSKTIHTPSTTHKNNFLVLFPAYKEDKVIIEAIQSFLKQTYPAEKYKVIVVADHMTEETIKVLQSFPIDVLVADYTDSSKAKALNLAIDSTPERTYDMVVIMDADNTTTENFLDDLNDRYNAGAKAIQAHRTAKNLNTDIAILDAISEEINNSIFRSGHINLGLSSALIGSGMAIEEKWFRQHVKLLQTAGEDKELEALLLKQGIHIEYLEKVFVYDEKTQKKEVIKNQRKRWLAAQFSSLFHTLPELPAAIFKGNIDYCDKIIQWMLPPRIILMAGVVFFTGLMTLISLTASLKWWILTGFLILTLLLAIPSQMINKRSVKALLHIPSLAWIMITNMFRLKGVNKKFIHTQHGD